MEKPPPSTLAWLACASVDAEDQELPVSLPQISRTWLGGRGRGRGKGRGRGRVGLLGVGVGGLLGVGF